ncbi:AMP-binding protein [Hydrogenophaga sp. OTU3427]|uniref:AMP-binding protein n=1 Tax=Hydrogenophaga sp. OTU3427 TaxID=3043856 RepID=UPI00313C6A50
MYVVNALHRAAQISPNRIATVHQGRVRTWSQLKDRVARLAATLQQMGIQRGERVALLGWNTDHYMECLLAVPWLGAVVVPINTRLAVPEVVQQLAHAEVRTLIYDKSLSGFVAKAIEQSGQGLRLLSLGGADDTLRARDAEAALKEQAPIPDANPQPDDMMGIFYTGGTTGVPKGVVATHANLAHQITLHAVDLGWSADTRYLHVLPLFHLGGMTTAFTLVSLMGCSHFMERFDAAQCLERLHDERITAVALSPVSIGWMLDSPRLAELDLSMLRDLSYGTAPITEALLRRAVEKLPAARFTQIYGQTEVTGTISALKPEDHTLDGNHMGRLRSAGRASAGVQVQVVDAREQPVPLGELGEIVVRSPGVMKGYLNNDEQTALTLAGGWLHTGDIGRLDADGFLFVMDRKKDMIVTGGENVYSSEVEQAIASCPGVAQVAVFGVPDDTWGEAVHAVVVPVAGGELTVETVAAHCRRLIAGFKCPKGIELRREPLPLSGVNKVQKHLLREPYWRDRARRVN